MILFGEERDVPWIPSPLQLSNLFKLLPPHYRFILHLFGIIVDCWQLLQKIMSKSKDHNCFLRDRFYKILLKIFVSSHSNGGTLLVVWSICKHWGGCDDADDCDIDNNDVIINMKLHWTSIDFCRALCPEGVTLRGLDSLASASLVVVAVPRYFGQMAMINIWLIIM